MDFVLVCHYILNIELKKKNKTLKLYIINFFLIIVRYLNLQIT